MTGTVNKGFLAALVILSLTVGFITGYFSGKGDEISLQEQRHERQAYDGRILIRAVDVANCLFYKVISVEKDTIHFNSDDNKRILVTQKSLDPKALNAIKVGTKVKFLIQKDALDRLEKYVEGGELPNINSMYRVVVMD